jgi:uncharacterized Rmd1/YagE family protein
LHFQTSLFEELVDNTIETCKDIPTQIALNGKISLTRPQINMQIGELFILRINIHLNGSVLDTPEVFWTEPHLEPVYQAVRSYLEMDQRVNLLTERLDVIADLLAVLKDQLSHGHGEKLEWIGKWHPSRHPSLLSEFWASGLQNLRRSPKPNSLLLPANVLG